MKTLLKLSLLFTVLLMNSCDKPLETSSQVILSPTALVEKLTHDKDVDTYLNTSLFSISDTLKNVMLGLNETQVAALRKFNGTDLTNPDYLRLRAETGIESAYQIKRSQMRSLALIIYNRYKTSLDHLKEDERKQVIDQLSKSGGSSLRVGSVCDDCSSVLPVGFSTTFATVLFCDFGWNFACSQVDSFVYSYGLSLGVCVYCCSVGNCR